MAKEEIDLRDDFSLKLEMVCKIICSDYIKHNYEEDELTEEYILDTLMSKKFKEQVLDNVADTYVNNYDVIESIIIPNFDVLDKFVKIENLEWRTLCLNLLNHQSYFPIIRGMLSSIYKGCVKDALSTFRGKDTNEPTDFLVVYNNMLNKKKKESLTTKHQRRLRY